MPDCVNPNCDFCDGARTKPAWDDHEVHLAEHAILRQRISDDLRAVRYQRRQAYRSSRRWTLASLAFTLLMLGLGLTVNIVETAARRVLHCPGR